MIDLVAEHGYSAVSVKELTDCARISKRDFYKLFAGKEECFLAAYDIIVSRSVRGIIATAEGEEDWRERLRLGFLAFADQITSNPGAARLALVEAFTAGAVAVERMQRTNLLFEALIAKNLALAGDAPRLPPLVVKGVVAGGSRLAQARLLSGSAETTRASRSEASSNRLTSSVMLSSTRKIDRAPCAFASAMSASTRSNG